MNLQQRETEKTDWSLTIIALVVLFIYLFYTYNFVLRLPYPGIALTNSGTGWFVNDSTHPELEVGAILLQIGDLPYSVYSQNRLTVPFEGLEPGDKISLLVGDTGEQVTITLPQVLLEDYWRRVLATLWFIPFWLAGTIVLLLIRPRDSGWRLLVAFFYLIGLWAILGLIANWQIVGARLVYGVCSWLLMPITIHLHLIVPRPLFPRLTRYLVPLMYGAMGIITILELLQLTPRSIPLYGFVFALAVSLGLMIYRLFSSDSTPTERLSVRLMLAGVTLAFLPGVIVFLIPQLLNIKATGDAALTIAYLAIPVLPLFYIYAIYKRRLGPLEFRANRLLSQYSFILLFPPIFLLLLLFGLQIIPSPGGRMVYLLLISILFVAVTPPLFSQFQQWVNRLAYGLEHDSDEVIRVFANQIPSALSREELVRLLTQSILPSIYIRQSMLAVFDDPDDLVWYTDKVDLNDKQFSIRDFKNLQIKASEYQPPPKDFLGEWDWVRLVIPLRTREVTHGLWLFGRRDPDDFYPKTDIDLLQALANQISPVLENIRLYEALRQQADSLADQVAERTSELKAERDRTQAILDSAGEGVFFMNTDAVFLYANPTFEHMTGYADNELLGEPLTLLESEDNPFPDMQAAFAEGQGWHGEMIQKRKDGSVFDVNLTIAPIEVEDGRLQGYVGVLSDISKLKEVDRLKTNIIANVSHELKTPLANITLYLQLMERGKFENQARYLIVLNRETDRLTRLISNLLDLSQLDTGDIPANFRPIMLPKLAAEIANSYQTRAHEKHIDIQLCLTEDLPLVLADKDQLEQVLVNLIVNAIAYTPIGGQIKLESGAGFRMTSDDVWVRVTDTGLGIAPEELSMIFERFYRGSASQKSKSSGTGLGLTICKEIMERHQGEIVIESEPGQGTAVTLWLRTVKGATLA